MYNQQIIIAKEVGDVRIESNCLGNIGNAYAKLKWVFLICLSLVLGLLAGCRAESFRSTETPSFAMPTSTRQQSTPTLVPLDVGEGGLLSGEPCGPPCLLNITPELTTEDDANAILGRYFDVRMKCMPWNQKAGRGINCDSIWVGFSDNHKVVNIDWIPSKTVTLGDVIAKHGNPDIVWVYSMNDDVESTDVRPVKMILYFGSIKTKLELPEQNETTYKVDPSIIIASVGYLTTSEYEKSTHNGQKWSGYGDYEINSINGPN